MAKYIGMTEEEFWKRKKETEAKGERWKVYIDENYGSDFTPAEIDESKLTEEEKERLSKLRKQIDEVIEYVQARIEKEEQLEQEKEKIKNG